MSDWDTTSTRELLKTQKSTIKKLKDAEDLLDFTLGEKKAFERGVDVAHDVLGRFEEIPEKLEIMDNILSGAIALRISKGMPVFENMIEGGIPRGSSLLLKKGLDLHLQLGQLRQTERLYFMATVKTASQKL